MNGKEKIKIRKKVRSLLLNQNQLLLTGLTIEVFVQVETQNTGFILLDTCGKLGEKLSNLQT